MTPTPCIHSDGATLCESCFAQWAEDPAAYDEFGDHPEGIARWRALCAEMAERQRRLPDAPLVVDSEIPF